MSTKTQQTSVNSYDPTSMNAFTSMTGGMNTAVNGYMNNPFSNPFFQTQQQMGTTQANQIGGTQMSNLVRNMTSSGMGGSNNPAMLEMMQNQGRANSNMTANLGFINPMQNAFTAQQSAIQTAANYRPLQTGGTQTQTQSGLGTWLPQVAGAAIGGLTGGLGSSLMKGFSGTSQGSQFSSPWFANPNMPTNNMFPPANSGGYSQPSPFMGFNQPSFQ